MKKKEDKRQQVVTIFILSIIFSVYGILFSGNEKAGLWSNEAFAQTAEEYFQQGKGYLENQLLTEAHTNFQSALVSDPNHQGANLFFALTRILMISNSAGFNTLLDRAGVNASGRNIFNWTADFTRDPQGNIILPSNSPTGEELQNFLKNNILPEVDGALTNLTKVGSGFQTSYKWPVEDGLGSVNSPNTLTVPFAFWMMNEWAGYKIVVEGTEYTIQSNTYDTLTVTPNWVIASGTYNFRILETVEIDYGDVLVLKGSLYLAKGGIIILSAYNVNVDIDTIVSLYNNLSLNFQNHVINTYTQLLTLLPGQQLLQAKSILRDAISTFTSAIDFIVGEGDPQGDDLFIIETLEEEQEYRNLLTDLNNALDGTTYIRKYEQYLNLSQFFDYPKVLRNYLPTFRGLGFIQSGTFPDPTFGGIMPYITANILHEKLREARLLVAPPPPLRPYDDFSGSYIDKNKWSSWELVCEIEDGKFVSETTAYGSRVRNRINFKNPTPINYIEADLTINKIEGVLGSSGIPNYSSPNAGITGFFYNDGSASGPGSYKGEVQGIIRIAPYNGMLWVYWYVWKLTNDEGTNSTTLDWNYFPDPVSPNTAYKLSIQFEPSSRTFTFKVGSTTRTWTSTDTIYPSNIPWKAIGTDVYFTGTGTELYGKISATFDNVIAKDESGYIVVSDDFSSSSIDSTKWTTYEFVREISGGKLRSALRSEGASLSNALSFPNPSIIKAIKAKVTPIAFNNPDGAFTSSRIGGYFFRNLEGWWWYYDPPPGGAWGDVWAEIGIGGSGTTPTAYWSVIRFTNVEGTTWEVLGSGTFPISINLGSTYDLYVYWDGFAFTFKCNEYEAVYAIEPPNPIYFGPPNIKFKGLQTRIRQTGTGQSALVESTFDDVIVDIQLEITDFDGDGKTDIAVYRVSNGGWYIIPSLSPGTPYGVGWGGDATDKPAPGDYDGDGKTDIAVYRVSNGGWYIIPSLPPGTPYGVGWGGDVTDKPAPGDYDGDGKTDIAVYRGGNGGWYIIPSSTPGAPYGVGWGGDGSDKPVPGDYDGDGKTDIAIYRGSNGGWYIIPSSPPGTPYGVGWGGDATDIPVMR